MEDPCSPNSPIPEIPPTGLCSGSSVGLSPQAHFCICARAQGSGLSVPAHV